MRRSKDASVGTTPDSAASRLVARQRLFDRLDERLASGAVALCADAGTGKSALVASYAHARSIELHTLRLGPEDADPFHLVVRLDAIVAAGHEITRLEAPVPDPFIAGRRAFRHLFASHESGGLLFLDDLERLPADSATQRLIADALEEVPAGWSMLLAGRDELSTAFARSLASSTITVIAADELRLDGAETRAVASRHASLPLSAERLDAIVTLADGWAALAVLLAAGARVPAPGGRPGELPEMVFAYLAEEVVGRLELPEQHDLEILSLLPELTDALAAQLGCGPDAPARLAALADRHFFVDRLEGKVDGHAILVSPSVETRYRMHGLFRRFLGRRLERRLGCDAMRETALRAAVSLESGGECETAIALRLEHGDVEGAASSIDVVAPDLLRQLRHATLLGWMRTLPDALVERSGTLSLWRGATTMLVDPCEARQWLERAHARLPTRDRTLTLLACCLAIDSWLLRWDDCHGMDVWIERLETALDEGELPPLPALQAQVCRAVLYSSLFRGTDPDRLAAWHARGLDLLDSELDSASYAGLAHALVLVPIWSSGMPLADLVLERVRARLFANGAPEPLTELWFRTFELPVLWGRGDRAAVERACERGSECARNSGARFSDVLLPYHAGIACLIAGDADAAARHAAIATANLRPEELMNAVCHHQLAGMLARHEGDAALAARQLERAAELAERAGLRFAAAWQYAGRGFVALDGGDDVEADRWLATARACAEELRLGGVLLDVLIAEAWRRLRRGERKALRVALERALSLAVSQARVASPWWSRPMLASLSAAALEEGIEEAHVGRILRAHAIAPPPEYRHLANWPWCARISVLHEARVVIDDAPLNIAGERVAKPVELILLLAALGGEASAATLADRLWPDAEGDAAMDSFKTTLARARRRLGIDGLLTLVDGRLAFDRERVWCDVDALNLLDRSAATAGLEATDAQRIDERILALQGVGPPTGSDREWTREAEQRTRAAWLRAVLRRADAFKERGLYSDEIAVFERALDRSPNIEVLYRRSMKTHLEAGAIEAGLLLAERCRRSLSQPPSPATEAVIQRLRSNAGAV